MRKKERKDLKDARRASVMDEEVRQMRARDIAVGPSSSMLLIDEMSTTNGVEIDVGTTE